MAAYIAPSSRATGFNCPHCGVLAKQMWHHVSSDRLKKDQTPAVWTADDIKKFDFSEYDEESKENLISKLMKASAGLPYLDANHDYKYFDVFNVHLSECFNCNKIAIWIYGNLLWPSANEAPTPNADLPDDVRADYDEAGLVLSISPRSAAALLRQAVQRLCKHIGGTGKNIDDDIAALVRNGLDPRVKKALDIVRVVGNNAVHPGQIDLKDDRSTAEKLFGLVNLIADIMISQPKHIDAMFDELPEGARKAIEKRDTPKEIEHKKT